MKGALRGIIILLIVIVSIVIGYSYANKINILETMVSGGGNPFDQSLNTTDDVSFNRVYTDTLTTNLIQANDADPLNIQGYSEYNFIGSSTTDIVMQFIPEYENGFMRINKTLNVTSTINVPTLNVMNMTMNSTGFYWLQGTTCKMRQFYNGTHWVTTGAC